ncbi:hypothetical protein F5884DRAFT_889401 [Xylogone sp. PMI_703]|nr:hypothetical protein F5884DRAFT_889401 [Xylogone sp. PMI_703]
MPRAKRPLAEVDTNARRKRVARNISKGQVEAQPTVIEDAISKTVERSKEARQSTPLVDAEIPRYETYCPPLRRAYKNDEENEEEEGEPHKVTRGKGKRRSVIGKKSTAEGKRRNSGCRCGTFHDEIPNWPFILSDGVLDRLLDFIGERSQRDQDFNGVYFYNNFTGYGIAEVFENYLKEFNRIVAKKDVSPAKKWEMAEALGWHLATTDLSAWVSTDDPNSNAEIVAMFGTMLLTCFDILDEHGLFTKDSPIKNIGLVATLFLDFALRTWKAVDAGNGEAGWTLPVVRALDKAGIDILITKEIASVDAKALEEIRTEVAEKEKNDLYEKAAKLKRWKPDRDYKKNDLWGLITVEIIMAREEKRREQKENQWHRWDWKKEWALFTKKHRGGNQYNISKMSAARRNEGHLNL